MFEARRSAIAGTIEVALFAALEEFPASELVDAMRWAVQGGKGLRGFLVIESAALYAIPEEVALKPAAAIEALHAYSLVHDDLPEMDNDALRRGRETLHIKWGPAMAVLAGDALQSLAFSLLASSAENLAPARQLALIHGLAKAAGASGMARGQARDMEATKTHREQSLDSVETLQKEKTGALIRWAAKSGAIMAGADPTPLERYADALGLAFQITDDLLDATGDSQRLGKATGKDARAVKATFVRLLGVDGAREKASKLIDAAKNELAAFGEKARHLKALADFIARRDY